jgi:hypothetical protein
MVRDKLLNLSLSSDFLPFSALVSRSPFLSVNIKGRVDMMDSVVLLLSVPVR